MSKHSCSASRNSCPDEGESALHSRTDERAFARGDCAADSIGVKETDTIYSCVAMITYADGIWSLPTIIATHFSYGGAIHQS